MSLFTSLLLIVTIGVLLMILGTLMYTIAHILHVLRRQDYIKTYYEQYRRPLEREVDTTTFVLLGPIPIVTRDKRVGTAILCIVVALVLTVLIATFILLFTMLPM